MKTCIVVLNYNDSDRTLKFIDDIKSFKVIDEIIVVDNCSKDGSYEVLKKIASDKITVLKTKSNKGYGAGNNLGCKYAIDKYEDPIIFISNPDIVVTEKVIKDIKMCLLKNKNTAIVAPNVYQDGRIERGWKLLSPIRGAFLNLPFIYRSLRKNEHSKYFYKKSHYNTETSIVDVVTGCFFAIKGSIMEEIGYFDENIFLYNEEEVLAKKTQCLGYNTLILNDSSVVHEHSVSISKSFSSVKKIKIANKSRMYYQKHYNDANNLEILFWSIVNFISVLKEYLKIISNKVRGAK